MDASQLRELATNALTGHWPPHLGVRTDQEKIEYLARQLESAADNIGDVNALTEEVEGLEDKRGELVDEVAELEAQIKERATCADCERCENH